AEVLFQSPKDVTAYDVKTGEKRWAYDLGGLSDIVSPTIAGELVLASGAEMPVLRPADGTSLQAAWKAPKLKSAGYPSPPFYQGGLYNVNGTGVVTAIDAKDGSVVWQSARVKGPFAASPIAADGKLYLTNEAGTTFVLGLGDKPELLGTNELGQNTL